MQNSPVEVDDDAEFVNILVTLYEMTVASTLTLPGTVDDYDAGDPTATPRQCYSVAATFQMRSIKLT